MGLAATPCVATESTRMPETPQEVSNLVSERTIHAPDGGRTSTSVRPTRTALSCPAVQSLALGLPVRPTSCLKLAGLAAQATVANLFDEVLVEFTGALGAGGGVKGRSLAATDVAIQREL
jgi:hypothetical protein